MTVNKALFSSARLNWATPLAFYQNLDREFNFQVDVCASAENTKCSMYYKDAEGLTRAWASPAFMNPPYGREISKWVKKAYEESLQGVTVVCLVPSRTDTAWWHDYIMRASEIRFIRGRLHFDGYTTGAPFPSAIIVFRGRV